MEHTLNLVLIVHMKISCQDFSLWMANGHYQVNLPWNRDKSVLPTHHQLCYNRLRSLQHKLLCKPVLMAETNMSFN